MTCPDCDRTFSSLGYAAHRRMAHPSGERDPSVLIAVRAPASMSDAVEARAKALGISVAEAGRRALAAWLAVGS